MDFEGLDEGLNDGWRQFISNGEGPITLNDNAYELCSEFIENGSEFFKVVSRYDDILSDVVQRPNYKAGDTLRLILPFLKACGVTDRSMLDFSRRNILIVPGARKTMRFVQEFMTPFIVATSYEHYITAVCDAIGFPMENVYCTALEMDSVKTDAHEAEILKNIAREIAGMSLPPIPEGARSLDDLSPQDQAVVGRLDEIFWEELTDLASYRFILDVNPVGGEEKASAVLDIRRRSGIGLEDTCYIGDSITDAQTFQLVREGDGLTVSFNGNEYALREAEFAIISDNTVVTSVLAEVFHKAGMEGVNNLADNWTMEGMKRSGAVNPYLLKEFERTFPNAMPVLARVAPDNIKALTRQSMALRRSIRGEAIGSLG
jgi:predicted HAD superfamily phosphohydrolase